MQRCTNVKEFQKWFDIYVNSTDVTSLIETYCNNILISVSIPDTGNRFDFEYTDGEEVVQVCT